MRLAIGDWEFEINMAATMEYSAKEAAEHCTCAYCRNFYGAVDDTYPRLRPFLAEFGVDIEAPDELMPYDVEHKLRCDGIFSVSGRILREGQQPITVDGVSVHPSIGNEIGINCGMPEPHFYLSLWDMEFDWILDEPMEDTVSPANEPGFIRRMINRLLRRSQKDAIDN